MSYPWNIGASNKNSEFGQVWDPADANKYSSPRSSYGFASTVTSFSAAGTTWANGDRSTKTSTSSSWPISSTGPLSNPSAGDWANSSSLSRDATEDSVEFPSGPPIKRWQDPDVNTVEDMNDDANEEMMEESMYQQGENTSIAYASPISKNEYEKQSKEYTKTAVEKLVASPEYQKRHTRCELCWCVWAEEQYRESCPECGGAAMKRSCPVCDGRCDATWTRDVDMSHSNHLAHWEGECKLPWEQRQGFLMQKLLETDQPVTEEQLAEDFSELKSS